MKKTIVFVGLILALALISGCGRSSSSAPGFGKDDLYLDIGGSEYRLNDNIDSVIAALGPDYDYSEAISCDYDGLDKTFLYDMAEFYTYPLPEGDLVSEIYTQSGEVATSKDIRVGASRDDVLAAYGDNCEDTGYQIIYSLPGSGGATDGGSLCFDMENGVVTAIYITTRPF